jgi:hypothetical protein
MNTPFKGFPESAERIVYVRPVAVADLPDEIRDQIGAVETVYSVNAPNGQQLALVADRKLAFHLARSHDFAPVSVH